MAHCCYYVGGKFLLWHLAAVTDLRNNHRIVGEWTASPNGAIDKNITSKQAKDSKQSNKGNKKGRHDAVNDFDDEENDERFAREISASWGLPCILMPEQVFYCILNDLVYLVDGNSLEGLGVVPVTGETQAHHEARREASVKKRVQEVLDADITSHIQHQIASKARWMKKAQEKKLNKQKSPQLTQNKKADNLDNAGATTQAARKRKLKPESKTIPICPTRSLKKPKLAIIKHSDQALEGAVSTVSSIDQKDQNILKNKKQQQQQQEEKNNKKKKKKEALMKAYPEYSSFAVYARYIGPVFNNYTPGNSMVDESTGSQIKLTLPELSSVGNLRTQNVAIDSEGKQIVPSIIRPENVLRGSDDSFLYSQSPPLSFFSSLPSSSSSSPSPSSSSSQRKDQLRVLFQIISKAILGFDKCAVFYHLHHSRNLTVTSGTRFGCHFLTYGGDPADFHSEFVTTVWSDNKEGELSTLDVVAVARLATQVKKSVLLASVQSESLHFPQRYGDMCSDTLEEQEQEDGMILLRGGENVHTEEKEEEQKNGQVDGLLALDPIEIANQICHQSISFSTIFWTSKFSTSRDITLKPNFFSRRQKLKNKKKEGKQPTIIAKKLTELNQSNNEPRSHRGWMPRQM